MYLNAESVKVDTDDGAITLEVFGYANTPDADEVTLTINIHGIDLDAFYNAVRSGVGGYLRERNEARTSRPEGVVVAVREDGSFRCDPDESAGAYDLEHFKHSDFHSVHADIWDARDGK